MPVRRCFFPRYFIFRDSNGIEIGRAATLWVLLDLGTRSMTKLDVVKALMPDNSDLLAPLGLPAAVTEVSGTLQTEMRQPRYTDLISTATSTTRAIWTGAATRWGLTPCAART